MKSSHLAVLPYIIFLLSNLKPCSSSTKTYTYWTIETTASASFPCGVDHAYAAGVDSSGIIWLGEGVECHDDYIYSYKPSTQIFTSTGCPSSCPITIMPVAQYYTQIGDILIKTDGRKFIYYNLISQSGWFNLQYSTLTNVKFPIRMETDSQCITSTPNDKLIGVGGLVFAEDTPSTAVSLYDPTSELWIDANGLPYARFSAGCIVHPYDSNLYVMGGSIAVPPSYNGFFHKLPYGGDYKYFGSYSWETYTNSILSQDHFGRLVAYNEWLIALGGYTATNSGYIIAWDISSGGEPTVIDSTSSMAGFQWGNAAHALVGNTIYVFGDDLQGDLLNWQTITLASATPEPTPKPTPIPTPKPTVKPTPNPTPKPTPQPTPAPTPSPTSSPTPKPTTNPTTANPTAETELPSMSPTAAPSVAPTPDKPTPSPTESNNMVFVAKDGCDCNDMCKDSGPTGACLTIEFAYDCFIGNNGCDSDGNDGNGNLYLGSGEWVWPTKLIYDNEQVVINGNGVNETTLYYDSASFIGCTWYKCWLEIRDLTISSNPNTSNVDPMQIHMYQGGTLVFRNVLFNGDNYSTNQNGNPFWILEDQRVTAIFVECVFENNDVMYHISDGASLQFIDCVFKDNVITQSSAGFVLRHASLAFDGCSFYNNSQMSGAFIDAWNSTLSVINCTFHHNEMDILMNVTDHAIFDTFDCLNASESSVIFDSNSFISNQFNTLITITSSSIHATDDTFDGNVCEDYCIQSTDSSVSIDLQSLYQNNLNFAAFHRVPSSSKSSLCIDGADIMEISKYLSFDDHSNNSNTKVIVNDCIDPFSVTYPNVSSVRLSEFEQIYLNDIAGGAVLDTFTCDDHTDTCSIVCNNSVSCFSSTFVVNTAVANINCGSNFACGYSTINGTQSSLSNHTNYTINDNNSSLHIVCDDETSCLHSTINV
eukprot:1021695_1